VRTLHQEGTTVVLVEQSVNLALQIAQHAYFMEKGEIRFSGAARDLLARDDLLRSVFLQGAARAIEQMRSTE
jgi:ABC-type branched-subunit amino acid transport system ATPase component